MSVTPIPQPIYGTFVNEINLTTAKNLTAALTLASQNGVPSFHLLIQSTGGTISEGVYLYNLLRASPIPVIAYNVGSVASSAVLAFLGAKTRVGSKHASFMIHRPQSAPQGADLHMLAAATASLKIDDARMDAILKAHLTLPSAKWRVYDRHPLWIGAQDALKAGFTTTIGDFAPPLGTPIYAFG